MPLGEPVSQNENKFEDRAFSFVAPKLWSSLPDCVRNATTLGGFKKNLKTHLFQKVSSQLVNCSWMSSLLELGLYESLLLSLLLHTHLHSQHHRHRGPG